MTNKHLLLPTDIVGDALNDMRSSLYEWQGRLGRVPCKYLVTAGFPVQYYYAALVGHGRFSTCSKKPLLRYLEYRQSYFYLGSPLGDTSGDMTRTPGEGEATPNVWTSRWIRWSMDGLLRILWIVDNLVLKGKCCLSN